MHACLQKPVSRAACRRFAFRLWAALSWAGFLCLAVAQTVALGDGGDKTAAENARPVAAENAWRAAALGGATRFDDVPQLFEPRRPPGEARRDRLHALTLFSTGCVSRQNNAFPEALGQFQRAYRYDPSSRTIAEAAVKMAEKLGRLAERDRYLYKLFELGGGNPFDIEELAFRTAMGGELKRSMAIYERLLDIRKDAEKEPIDVVMHWRLAEVYYLAGENKKAARCAAWVVDALDHPEKFGLDAEVVHRLIDNSHLPVELFGEFFLLAGQTQRAKAMFERANAAAPDKVLLEYRLARIDARMKRYKEALGRLEFCLGKGEKLRGKGLAPYELLQEVLDGLGKKSELAGRLEKLRAASPHNVVLGYALADCYRRTSQAKKAETLYKRLLAKHPAAVGYAGLLEIYRAEKRIEPLLALLGKVAGETASFEQIGDVLRDGTADGAADGALLDKLAEAARGLKTTGHVSSHGNACLAVAFLALDAKRFDLAGEFFERAMESNPHEAGNLIIIWSTGLLAEERGAEAAAVLRRGFKQKLLDEDKPVPYYYLANALAMCDKFEEALAAASKAAELQDDSPHFAVQQGWVLYHAKRYDEAAAVYDKLIKRFDGERKNEDIRDTMRVARLALAGIEATRGNTRQAESLLEEVLDEFPDDISALNDLGYLWADDNRHLRRALRMTRKAVEAEPDNAAYRDSLGWALFRLGRLEEAAAELKKAADSAKDEEILKHFEQVRKQMAEDR